MKTSLAIIIPVYGSHSEHFLRRQIEGLKPDLIIASSLNMISEVQWDLKIPLRCINQDERKVHWRLWNILQSRLKLETGSTRQFLVQKWLKQFGINLILSNYLDFSLDWILPAQNLNIPIYAHGHGYDVSVILRDAAMRQRYLDLNKTHGIIVPSRLMAGRLKEIGVSNDLLHVIPYGVEPTIHAERRTVEKDRPVRALAIGRMVPKKAPILTLAAFAHAAKACPQLELDYVGGGPLLPAVRDYVDTLGMGPRIRLHDARPHEFVLDLIKKADLFIQHSVVAADTGDEEGLPVAILEAMAMGLPVVSTIHAGIPEAIQHGVHGMLVAERDWKTMGNYILKLANNPSLRDELGRHAAAAISARFTIQQEIEALQKLLFRESAGSP